MDVGPQNPVSRAGSMSSVASSSLQRARGRPLPYLPPPVHASGPAALQSSFPWTAATQMLVRSHEHQPDVPEPV